MKLKQLTEHLNRNDFQIEPLAQVAATMSIYKAYKATKPENFMLVIINEHKHTKDCTVFVDLNADTPNDVLKLLKMGIQ